MIRRGFDWWFGTSVRARFEVADLPPDALERLADRARAGEFPIRSRARRRVEVGTDEAGGYRGAGRARSLRIVRERASMLDELEDVRLAFDGASGVDCEVAFPRLRRMVVGAIAGLMAVALIAAVVATILGLPPAAAIAGFMGVAIHAAIFGIAPLWSAQASASSRVERALYQFAAESRVRVASEPAAERAAEVEAEAEDEPLSARARRGAG